MGQVIILGSACTLHENSARMSSPLTERDRGYNMIGCGEDMAD
jgi:hypothetical protein